MQSPAPPQANTLGNAGLALGIVSASLVFGLGVCAVVGAQQGWLGAAGTLLFVCAASSAFLGVLGAVASAGGLFGANRSKATAVVGLVFSLIGVCLFLGVVRSFQGG